MAKQEKQSAYKLIIQQVDFPGYMKQHYNLEIPTKGNHCCQIHDDTNPSAFYYKDTNTAFCPVCNKRHSLIDYVMKIENVPQKEAMQIIAKNAGIILTDDDKMYDLFESITLLAIEELVNSVDALNYLHARGFTDEIITECRIGFYSKKVSDAIDSLLEKHKVTKEQAVEWKLIAQNEKGYYSSLYGRILFPIKNESGRIIGLQGRATDSTQKVKYYTVSRLFVWGLEQELKNAEKIYVVEGIPDAVTLRQHGFVAIAILGANAKISKWVKNHIPSNKIVMLTDNDDAGKEKSTVKIRELFGDIHFNIIDYKTKLVSKVDDDEISINGERTQSEIEKSTKDANGIYTNLIEEQRQGLITNADEMFKVLIESATDGATTLLGEYDNPSLNNLDDFKKWIICLLRYYYSHNREQFDAEIERVYGNEVRGLPTRAMKSDAQELWDDSCNDVITKDFSTEYELIKDAITAEKIKDWYIEENGQDFFYVDERNRWYKWNDVIWKPDGIGKDVRENFYTFTVEIQNKLRSYANVNFALKMKMNEKWIGRQLNELNHLHDVGKIDAMVRSLQKVRGELVENVDKGYNYITFLNGYYDLENYKFIPLKDITDEMKQMLITTQLPYEYNPNDDCPLFKKILSEITINIDGTPNDELKVYLSGILASGLTDYKPQEIFILDGGGSNGKSLLMDVMYNTLTENFAGKGSTELFKSGNVVNKDEKTNSILDKRYVYFDEFKETAYLDEEKAKQITGSRTIESRGLYKSSVTRRTAFTLIIALNDRPVITGTSEGIWRRIRVLPMNGRWSDDEDKLKENPSVKRSDKLLLDKILKEKSGIIQYLLRNLEQYKGIPDAPQIVKDMTLSYRESSDTVGQFLNEVYEHDKNSPRNKNDAEKSDIYREYDMWAKSSGIQHKFGKQKFNEILIKKEFEVYKDGKGILRVRGLRQKDETGL